VSWYLAQAGWLERVRSRAYRDFLRQQYGAAVAEGGERLGGKAKVKK
jgi:hypothetical protein